MLATLADLGSRTQAQLCRHLGVDRGPDPDDRRRNIVVATEEGLAALDGFDRIIGYADAALLASLPSRRRLSSSACSNASCPLWTDQAARVPVASRANSATPMITR